jgi:hypothetical protein
MQLDRIEYMDLPAEPVREISAGVVYFVSEGRNAWHSTWVKNYSRGSIHSSLTSAKAHAEEKRVQGSVFYIEQLPALIFRSATALLVVTEINNTNPLSGYMALCLKSPDVRSGQAVGLSDNFAYMMSPISGVFRAFDPRSGNWVVRPRAQNSVIPLSAADHCLSFERITARALRDFRSKSIGGRHYLKWVRVDPYAKTQGVKRLLDGTGPVRGLSPGC